MQNGRLQQHAESFKSGADGYDRHRPSYPALSVAWLRGHASGALSVLGLGAGTGKLSELLIAHGDEVTAVDPSADMLRVAAERVPQLRVLRGTGEQIPLPDSSVDLVTVAQAWHWMNHEVTSGEVVRVLRPGGRLGLIWNRRDDDVPWVAELSEAMHQGAFETRFAPELGAGLALESMRTERWMQETTREGILQLATTRSYYLVADESERSALLKRVSRVLDSHPETRANQIMLPYVTESWLASPRLGDT